ncbi:MAG: hypothetical protein QOD97_145, partial [Mycobacterium sp.]|nr:hypothetical protein [Mycobacterium sp.]
PPITTASKTSWADVAPDGVPPPAAACAVVARATVNEPAASPRNRIAGEAAPAVTFF